MNDYVAKVLKSIDLEFDARNEESDKRKSRETEDRIADGSYIANVSVIFDTTRVPKGMIQGSDVDMGIFTEVNATFESNISRFKKGDLIDLSGNGINFTLSVASINNSTAKLMVSRTPSTFICMIPLELINSDNWSIEERQLDLRKRLKSGILEINGNSHL